MPYGAPTYSGEALARGIVIAYWFKVLLASYAVAYHEFGFRLPSLPFDLAYLMQLLQ